MKNGSNTERQEIARRIARELKDGYVVNLGIGMPTLVANYVPEGFNIIFQSENGLLGMGPFPYAGEEDPDLVNAGKQTVTALPGDRKSTRLNSSHSDRSRMPSSA